MDHRNRILSDASQLEAARRFSERAKACAQWRRGSSRGEGGLRSGSSRSSAEQPAARPLTAPDKASRSHA